MFFIKALGYDIIGINDSILSINDIWRDEYDKQHCNRAG